MFFKCQAPGHVHHNQAVHAPAGHAQTVSDGKKHFTVDIHCHLHVAEADEMLKSLSPERYRPHHGGYQSDYGGDK